MPTQRWQFSLSGMMLAVSLIGIVMALYTYSERLQERFDRAAERLSDKFTLKDQNPPDFPHDVDERYGSRFGDDDLRAMGELGTVERLHLTIDAADVSDEGIRAIAQLQGLRELDLTLRRSTNESRITPEGVRGLMDASRLEKLSLVDFPASGEALADLGSLPVLKSLSLRDLDADRVAIEYGPPNLEAIQLAGSLKSIHLQGLPRLRVVNMETFGGTQDVTLTDMPQLEEMRLSLIYGRLALRNLPKLKTVTIASTRIDAASLSCIAKASGLRELELLGNVARDDALSDLHADALREMQSLELLHIQGFDLSDRAIQAIADLDSLKTLRIYGCWCADHRKQNRGAGWHYLSGCRNLDELSLEFVDADSPRSLNWLAEMKQLKRLSVVGLGLQNADLEFLLSAMPWLDKISINGFDAMKEGQPFARALGDGH